MVGKQGMASVIGRDRKEPEPSNNKPNKNPGFAKTRTEPESNVQEEPKPNWTYPVKNRTRAQTQMSSFFHWVKL